MSLREDGEVRGRVGDEQPIDEQMDVMGAEICPHVARLHDTRHPMWCKLPRSRLQVVISDDQL